MNVRRWLSILALLSAVVACGGGSDGNTNADGVEPGDGTPTDDVDASAEAIQWDASHDGSPPSDVDHADTGTDTGDDPGGDATGDTGHDTGHDTVDPGGSFFPSSELTIRILGPASGDTASALGNVTSLGGAVFGKYDTITWKNITNGSNGAGTGAPFWKTGPVLLANGDNLLEVEAHAGQEVARDTITVTYNPGFRWDRTLEARPAAVFVGDTYSIYVTAWMAFYTNYSAGSVKVIEVDETGQTIGTASTMFDDGKGSTGGGSSCDTIAHDGIFCASVKLNTSTPRIAHLRATAQVTAGAASYTAYSEVLDVPVLARIPQADCDAMQQLTSTVHAQFEQAFQQAGDRVAARDQVIASLQGNPIVAQVGPAGGNGSGLWVVYQNGVLGGFTFPAPGLRGAPADEIEALDTIESPLGGPTVGSKRVSLLSPFSSDFPGTDETAEFASRMSPTQCPPFEIEGGASLAGEAASVKRFIDMAASGFVGIVTHGDALFGGVNQATRDGFDWASDESHEVLWTGEVPICTNLQQAGKACTINQGQDPATVCPGGQFCVGMTNNGNSVTGQCFDTVQADLRLGRLAFGKTYGVLPGFVDSTPTPFPNSLIYLGACRSLFNGSMASAFFAAGAKAVFGYTGNVSSAFAFDQGKQIAEKVLVDRVPTGDAFEAGHTDPSNPTTAFELFGATNLDVNNSEVVNPSWELGNLTGWITAGDGRVISKLGATSPVAGKFMGVVSTGMGYTLQVGSMKQKFCIPTDANKLQFYWNYCSEEFKEFCGTQYQDPFTAAVKGSAGNITMVDVTVDSLCPSSSCLGCGGDYVGVYESDVDFDQGDAWCTRWQKSKTNVAALATQGKPVELQFFVTDEGDSIYDTVILIDDVRFLTE